MIFQKKLMPLRLALKDSPEKPKKPEGQTKDSLDAPLATRDKKEGRERFLIPGLSDRFLLRKVPALS